MLPSYDTPGKGCHRNVSNDNCGGPQMPFTSDEDSMMSQHSEESGKKQRDKHSHVNGKPNRLEIEKWL